MEDKLITVSGKGSIHVEPDVVRLDLSLVSIHTTYEDAYAEAKSNADRLSRVMKEIGLPVTLPKTISLNIDKKTKYARTCSEGFNTCC